MMCFNGTGNLGKARNSEVHQVRYDCVMDDHHLLDYQTGWHAAYSSSVYKANSLWCVDYGQRQLSHHHIY